MPRVRVNKETCIGCGVCWSLAPDVFEEDPATRRSRIKEPYRKNDSESESVGEIPEELKEPAQNAANACPTGSITIE